MSDELELDKSWLYYNNALRRAFREAAGNDGVALIDNVLMFQATHTVGDFASPADVWAAFRAQVASGRDDGHGWPGVTTASQLALIDSLGLETFVLLLLAQSSLDFPAY